MCVKSTGVENGRVNRKQIIAQMNFMRVLQKGTVKKKRWDENVRCSVFLRLLCSALFKKPRSSAHLPQPGRMHVFVSKRSFPQRARLAVITSVT